MRTKLSNIKYREHSQMVTTQRYADQIAVVTGGSTGIGFAIAKQLIQEGAKRVYITGRSADNLSTAAHQLGTKAIPVVSDVAKLADLHTLQQAIEHQGDTLNAIFANAGIAEYNQLTTSTEAEFDRMFDINVKGVFFTVQTLLPLLKDGGSIVLTSSVVANKGMENLSFYSASKAAVRSFARSWANDLKGRKIRVNALSPGLTDTPIMVNGLKLNETQLSALNDFAMTAVPLGYIAQTDEIAHSALFLGSSEASYVNGIELTVDGGMTQI